MTDPIQAHMIELGDRLVLAVTRVRNYETETDPALAFDGFLDLLDLAVAEQAWMRTPEGRRWPTEMGQERMVYRATLVMVVRVLEDYVVALGGATRLMGPAATKRPPPSPQMGPVLDGWVAMIQLWRQAPVTPPEHPN